MRFIEVRMDNQERTGLYDMIIDNMVMSWVWAFNNGFSTQVLECNLLGLSLWFSFTNSLISIKCTVVGLQHWEVIWIKWVDLFKVFSVRDYFCCIAFCHVESRNGLLFICLHWQHAPIFHLRMTMCEIRLCFGNIDR